MTPFNLDKHYCSECGKYLIESSGHGSLKNMIFRQCPDYNIGFFSTSKHSSFYIQDEPPRPSNYDPITGRRLCE